MSTVSRVAGELYRILKRIEFKGYNGNRCPECFGWNADCGGESDKVHDAKGTCELNKALLAYEKMDTGERR